MAVHGSGQLSPSLLGLGLVDELRLMIFPVVIVDGKRFFGGPRLRNDPEEKEPEPDRTDNPQWFSQASEDHCLSRQIRRLPLEAEGGERRDHCRLSRGLPQALCHMKGEEGCSNAELVIED